MRTIALVTAKGGSGKSTLTAGIGVAAHEAGEKVYLIDLDPQQSLLRWAGRRQADTPGVMPFTR
jgi:chromosome partitioning protein